MKSLLLSLALLLCLAPAAFSQEATKSPTILPQEDGTVLIAQCTIREAMENALRRQRVLTLQLQEAAASLEGIAAEKRDAQVAEVTRLQNELNVHNRLLALALAQDGQPVYLLDGEKNLIYQRLGTPEEAFLRLVARQGLLEKAIREAGDDAEKLARLNTQLSLLRRVLSQFFGIDPQRRYSFNAENGILYRRSTPQEAKELQQKLKERMGK
ncbi:MAG: hypothetical protein ACI4SG_02590 [Oligosphaeraceae bacterium]